MSADARLRAGAVEAASTEPVLAVERLGVSYGGIRALRDVDLEVGPGELVGLIGPNGAGKTTFIDAVSGFARYTGRVRLGNTSLDGLRPHQRTRHGLARTWQSIELFDGLTVAENVAVAAVRRRMLAGLRDTLVAPRGLDAGVAEALDAVGLSARAEAPAADLSQGERKLVGVARALAGRPRLVCLDEPAAGLDSTESVELGRRLRSVVDTGTSLLLVDHDMALVLEVCDRVVVLEFGAVVAGGPPERVRQDPAVLAAYLGSAAGREAVGGSAADEGTEL